MPESAVNRVLEYVGVLLLLTLASTFAWWIAATVWRAEYRRLLSGLACSMRIFFYSICLLCILVFARSIGIGPQDPRSTLFGWIHIGGTIWICGPSAWRAFRAKGLRLAAIVATGWVLCGVFGLIAWAASDGFREIVRNLPRYLTTA